jgi:hypothetical protein
MRSQFVTLATAVMEYATANYTRDGWDFLVECLTINEIADELAILKIEETDLAIEFYRELCLLVDDRREDAIADIF